MDLEGQDKSEESHKKYLEESYGDKTYTMHDLLDKKTDITRNKAKQNNLKQKIKQKTIYF